MDKVSKLDLVATRPSIPLARDDDGRFVKQGFCLEIVLSLNSVNIPPEYEVHIAITQLTMEYFSDDGQLDVNDEVGVGDDEVTLITAGRKPAAITS